MMLNGIKRLKPAGPLVAQAVSMNTESDSVRGLSTPTPSFVVALPASAPLPPPVPEITITYDDLVSGKVKSGVAILEQFRDFSLVPNHQGFLPTKWKIHPNLPRGILLSESTGKIGGKIMESGGKFRSLPP